MRQKSGRPDTSSERIVRNIRRATRKQYSAEEKIKILRDGAIRGGDSQLRPRKPRASVLMESEPKL